jgi:hypothetical protein
MIDYYLIHSTTISNFQETCHRIFLTDLCEADDSKVACLGKGSDKV